MLGSPVVPFGPFGVPGSVEKSKQIKPKSLHCSMDPGLQSLGGSGTGGEGGVSGLGMKGLGV